MSKTFIWSTIMVERQDYVCLLCSKRRVFHSKKAFKNHLKKVHKKTDPFLESIMDNNLFFK